MAEVDFKNAYYIKLGQGGKWAPDSIASGKMRFGWKHQSLADINVGNWTAIGEQLREEHKDKPLSVPSTDLSALRWITESTEDDVWITFHESKLWWTRLRGPVCQDETCKFRETALPWSDKRLNGKPLVATELPGKIAQLMGFRGTVCRVRYRDLLKRTLNCTQSELATSISSTRISLASHLTAAIRELHWKDFETFVDLIFRNAGWVRESVLGQHAKAYDLVLRESITGYLYAVQVKSTAGYGDLLSALKELTPETYRKVFFIVHSPKSDLATAADIPNHVEILPPERLGELALEAGLINWLEAKVS